MCRVKQNFITIFYNIAEQTPDIFVCMCMFIICNKVSFSKNSNQDGVFLSFILAFFYYLRFFCVVCFLAIYFFASYFLCHILQIKEKTLLCQCNRKDALTVMLSKGKIMLVPWFFLFPLAFLEQKSGSDR